MVPAWIAVAVGGALGSLARYFLALWAAPISRELPWGTILINIGGSFLIGFFGTLTLASGRFPAPDWLRLFVMVGFCGGFTTFSSFSLQTFDLFRDDAWGRGLANVAISVLLCLGSVALGHVVASHLNRGAVQVAETIVEQEAS